MAIQAIIFDAYGTLFDVYSISALAERLFPGDGKALAELWRDKQIEYTRLRTLSNTYKPFWEITQDALIFSCRKLGLDLTLDAQSQIMGQYAELKAFPESLATLQTLRGQGKKLAILSNGNPEMLDAVVQAAGMQTLLNAVLSVHAVKKIQDGPRGLSAWTRHIRNAGQGHAVRLQQRMGCVRRGVVWLPDLLGKPRHCADGRTGRHTQWQRKHPQ